MTHPKTTSVHTPAPDANPSRPEHKKSPKQSNLPQTIIQWATTHMVAAAAILIVSVLAVTVVVQNIIPSRSVEAFCSTLKDETVRLSDKYNKRIDTMNAQRDPLASMVSGIGSLLEAQGDLVVLFDRLDKVAPDEIQPDVAAVREAFKKQADSIADSGGNPFGALFGGLVSSLQAQGSFTNVDTYIKNHCDLKSPQPDSQTKTT